MRLWTDDPLANAKRLTLYTVLAMLVISSFIVFPVAHGSSPSVNHIVTNHLPNASILTTNIQVDNSNDVVVITAQALDGVSAATVPMSVVSVSDFGGDAFTLKSAESYIIGVSCAAGNCYDAEVWSAVIANPATITVTVQWNRATQGGQQVTMYGYDTTGYPAVPRVAFGRCNTCSSATAGSSVTYGPGSLLIASEVGCNVSNCVPGASYTLECIAALGSGGCSEYQQSGSGGGATSFPWSLTAGSSQWAIAGAVFGTIGSYSCSITNMDGGNYVLANTGKTYDFRCVVASSGVGAGLTNVTDIRVQFNDSVNVVTGQWFTNAATGLTGFRLLNGQAIATLSGGNVTTNVVSGLKVITADFLFSFNQATIDSLNRGIQLFALNTAFQNRGYEYVQTNYFNFYNQGGSTTLAIKGTCSVPSGADTFQTLCQYNASPKSSIQENSTWYHLQQFQGLFSIKLANNYGNPDARLWQDYANSGMGAANSSNIGDWKIDVGFYTWDNSSNTCCWVKTIHAVVSMLAGRQGTNNEWTEFKVGWFDGTTLIANQTFAGWIEQNPLSQVTLWVNLWYSQNNASTTLGGHIGAYYTGMHNNGYLWWTSWSPFLQNDSTSQVFMPLKNHLGTLVSSQLAQFTKVYMNMSRPGVPNVHTGQPNFQVITRSFQIESFGIAPGAMASIDTPSFTAAVVPIIQNTGFFSPLIRVITGLANLIVGALTWVGTQAWNALGSQFPWFTAFVNTYYQYAQKEWGLLSQIIGYVVGLISALPAFLGPIGTIVNLISSSWKTIQGIYLPIFTGANLSAIITIAVLWIFGGWVIENAEKGDTGAFVKGATMAWRIFFSIFNVMWMIAKFVVDAIEGLIP